MFQATAEPSTVSIADMSCSANVPDEPIQNGGDSIEEIIERLVMCDRLCGSNNETVENIKILLVLGMCLLCKALLNWILGDLRIK